MENLTFNVPMSLVLILLLGYFGYRIFKLMHIPGGAITGSLLIVAVFSSLGIGWADLPTYYSTSFQVVLGIVMGCRFSKETVCSIKKLVVPGLFTSAWMIGLSLAMGLLLTQVTGIDLDRPAAHHPRAVRNGDTCHGQQYECTGGDTISVCKGDCGLSKRSCCCLKDYQGKEKGFDETAAAWTWVKT